MGYSPVLIGPFSTGLQTDLDPWISPPDSFREIENAHITHGYIEKRRGYVDLATFQTKGTAIAISAATNADPCVVTVASVATLSNGDRIFIDSVTGMTELNNNFFTIQNINGGANTFELSGIDSSAYGVYAGAGSVYLVSDDTDRIMGLYQYVESDGTKNLLAFNTTRACLYNTGSQQFDPLDTANIMSGSDEDYIWATNWQSFGSDNRLYFTNGKQYNGGVLDGIRYYAGNGISTTSFVPPLNTASTRFLYGCKLIFAIKQRLVCLYTYELDSVVRTNPQRARWCAVQNPGTPGSFGDEWNDTVAGGGGFVDAPTGEQIISARSLQDSIVVFFTDSVWMLRPTSDPALPFRWDKINDFRACNGKMGSAGFDRYVIAIGARGITATDGIETRRADEKISDFTTDEINSDEFKKVFCARNYQEKKWWSLYPAIENDDCENALIYDEDTASFSTYEISMNVLGYGQESQDLAFQDFTAANNKNWDLNGEDELGDETFIDFYFEGNQELFLGGDRSGKVYILDIGSKDDGTDFQMTFTTASWAPGKEEGLETQLGYIDFYFDSDIEQTATIQGFKNTDFAPYVEKTINFLPDLGYIANISQISNTSPCAVKTPSHGLSTGDTIYIYGVDGMDELIDGPFTITVVDENNITLDGIDATAYSVYTGGGALYKRKFYKEKVWKRVFLGGYGSQHRIKFTSTVASRPIKIHAMKPYFRKRGKRTIR